LPLAIGRLFAPLKRSVAFGLLGLLMISSKIDFIGMELVIYEEKAEQVSGFALCTAHHVCRLSG
jgi:hypothetical protein